MGGGLLSPLSPRFRRPYELTYIVEQSENRKKVLMGMHILKYDTYFWCLFKVTSILSCFMKFWGHVVNEPYFHEILCIPSNEWKIGRKIREVVGGERIWTLKSRFIWRKPCIFKITLPLVFGICSSVSLQTSKRTGRVMLYWKYVRPSWNVLTLQIMSGVSCLPHKSTPYNLNTYTSLIRISDCLHLSTP